MNWVTNKTSPVGDLSVYEVIFGLISGNDGAVPSSVERRTHAVDCPVDKVALSIGRRIDSIALNSSPARVASVPELQAGGKISLP